MSHWRGPGPRPKRAPRGFGLARNPFLGNPLSGLGLGLNPVRRRGKRRRRGLARNPRRYSRRRGLRRRRNPLSLAVLKDFTAKSQVQEYPWLIGGVVAGGVGPRLIVGLMQRLGIAAPGVLGTTAGNVALGIGGTALGAVLASFKGVREARLVIGGGVAGVIGNVLIGIIDRYMPQMGLGSTASSVRRAVEARVRRAMGDFVTTKDVAQAPVVSGFSDFVTPRDIDAAPVVSGFGQDVAEGSEGFGSFDGDTF